MISHCNAFYDGEDASEVGGWGSTVMIYGYIGLEFLNPSCRENPWLSEST